MNQAIYRDVLEKIGSVFSIPGSLGAFSRFGSGHIHETFRVSYGADFIVQRMNTSVFPEPFKVMENIDKVTGFLREGSQIGSRSNLKVLNFLRCSETGSLLYVDNDGGYWRVAELIPDSISFDKGEDANILKEGGRAFGAFFKSLTSFDAASLNETIPRFHDTVHRFEQLEEAASNDKSGRASKAQTELNGIRQFKDLSSIIIADLSSGALKLQVTHNDTKINNVLFSTVDKRAICVVDLDTVMPGSMLYDFGDLIRTTCSRGEEDEADLSKVKVNFESLKAVAEGYLGEVKSLISKREKELLYTASIVMTLELAARFLTDHLNGDLYFRVHRPGHNLDRTRAQLTLARELMGNKSKGEKIIAYALGS